MDRIKEMLDRLSELSEQELSELEDLVLSEFETLEKQETTAQTVDAMTNLADSLDTVRTELTTRTAAAAELSRRAEEAKARVKGSESPDEAGEPDAVEPAAEAASADAPHEYVAGPDGKCTVCGKDSDDAAHTAPVQASAAAVEPTTDAVPGDEDEPVVALTDASTTSSVVDAAAEALLTPTVEDVAPTSDVDVAPSAATTPEAPLPELVASTDETPASAEPASPVVPAELAKDETEDTTVATPDVTTETGEDKSEDTVTASATPEASEPVVTAPADRQPVPRQFATASVAITAGADIPGVSAGSPLDDMDAVAEAMSKRMHQMRRTTGGDGEQHTVATLVASFPEDRVLKTDDPNGNAKKIDAVISPEAITAAGGICAPVNVQYDLFGLGSLGRPVKDALAPFNADRGGIRHMTSPTLTDLSGAVSLWTLQDDIDAATEGAPDPVKPCLRVACGSEMTVYTDAIPLCLTFGNLNARAYPELVARHNELALIQHARFAETRLLTRIGTLSTAVTATRKIGAVPDYFATLDRATAAYRSRHRIDEAAPLRAMLPQWFRELMRADMAYRMPGDGIDANLAIADAEIMSLFRARNVNPTFFMDGEAGQIFGAQAAGALLDFPDNIIWYLFAEGTFLFLDGGTLDLGLVRDSSLNSTNDYKMFIETFEGVAKVGIESLRVTSRLEPTGMVAGTVDLTAGVAA